MASEIVDQSELREGTATITKGQGNRLTYTSVFNYLVVTDSRYVSREEVLLNTPGLPVVGLNYGLINAICTSKTATRTEENALYWKVSCSFDTGREDQQNSPEQPDDPDPTTWIPLFTLDGFETEEVVLLKDKDDNPCVNSAKQKFATPITGVRTLCSFSITQFEKPDQDINVFMDRNETVNEIAFKGRAIRTLRLQVTSAELGYFGQFRAWKVGYKFTYNPKTWDLEVLDIGSQYKNAAGTQLLTYYDSTNTTVILGPLNTDGTKFADITLPPLTKKFRIYNELKFASFIRG